MEAKKKTKVFHGLKFAVIEDLPEEIKHKRESKPSMKILTKKRKEYMIATIRKHGGKVLELQDNQVFQNLRRKLLKQNVFSV